VLEAPRADWRTRRREAARSDIVAAAWELAREHGIAGLSLRDLGRRVGLAAPSLYSYFDSKNALYDAMFADGWRSLLELGAPPPAPDLRTALDNAQRMFLEWALADPVRYQLLNQRTIPGFEPSPESYEVAKQVYALGFRDVERHAELTQPDRDLVTAMVSGLINQQIANEPGGTRWVRLLDDVIDLLTVRLQSRTATPTSPGGRAALEEDR
jgi:AcrR family transcriptional regulator